MFKLLWLDMEMTGLDVSKEVPIEVALSVTGTDLVVKRSYHTVIWQPPEILEQMDAWNKKHHGESGLVAAIPNGKKIEVVEQEILQFIDQDFDKKDRIILAGNSIAQDRLFVDKYFKQWAKRLHYRMLDVSAFKILFNNFYNISYAKPEARHRATGDIEQSILEFKKYLSFIKVD
jgi:oligoribonuclease